MERRNKGFGELLDKAVDLWKNNLRTIAVYVGLSVLMSLIVVYIQSLLSITLVTNFAETLADEGKFDFSGIGDYFIKSIPLWLVSFYVGIRLLTAFNLNIRDTIENKNKSFMASFVECNPETWSVVKMILLLVVFGIGAGVAIMIVQMILMLITPLLNILAMIAFFVGVLFVSYRLAFVQLVAIFEVDFEGKLGRAFSLTKGIGYLLWPFIGMLILSAIVNVVVTQLFNSITSNVFISSTLSSIVSGGIGAFISILLLLIFFDVTGIVEVDDDTTNEDGIEPMSYTS